MAKRTRPFNVQERALLDRLAADEWPGVEAAREQLRVAAYGGPSHGKDNCFDIEVAGEVSLIEQPNGPVYGLVVYDADEPTGFADLWIRDGRLSGFEHS